MTYEETLDWLFEQLPVFQRDGAQAYKANLDNTCALDSYFGHPHTAYKNIHIAGTNGKGSTSHMLASILMEAGYKVGLYTSPHLKDFSERIRINGKTIEQNYVISFVNTHRGIITEIRPSFFEITVAMAFLYFKACNVDYAVIETGMGGRLDSTNILAPELSIITNISKDHSAFLGETLTKIAEEKAGIMKHRTPVVIGRKDKEYASVFTQRGRQLNCNLIFAEDLYSSEYKKTNNGSSICLSSTQTENAGQICIKSPLLGLYQIENIRTAFVAAQVLYNLGTIPNISCATKGIEKVQHNCPIRGRWETLSNNPLIICDTGHNKDGIEQIAHQLNMLACKKMHVVWGMANDKDANEIIPLLPRAAHYYLCAASLPRAMDTKKLSHYFASAGFKFSTHESCTLALKEAKNNYNSGDAIFIGGSTFVVAELID